MTRQHLSSIVAALVACASCALISQSTRADEPVGEVRYFFELLFIGGTDPGHDFESPESRRIVSYYAGNFGHQFTSSGYLADRTILDADGNILLDVYNSTWVPSSVLHITDDRVETLQSIYWLVDDWDDVKSLRRMLNGGTTATGPDGDVVTLGEAYAGDDGSGFLKLSNSPSGMQYRLRFSVGLFNK